MSRDSALKTLYIGPNRGTSRHRFLALRRCGHAVDLLDPYTDLGGSDWFGGLVFAIGFMGVERRIARHVLCTASERTTPPMLCSFMTCLYGLTKTW